MTLEQLMKQGLSEEQAKSVLSLYEENLKGYVAKSKFDELNTAKTQLETQVADREKQLKELKTKVGDNEELKTKIEAMEKENKAQKEQYENAIKELKLDTEIRTKLADTKYPDLLANKIDKSKLSIHADGTVVGIDEQITVLKDNYKELFQKTVSGVEPSKQGNPTPQGRQARIQELEKIVSDTTIRFAERIAAQNELHSLQQAGSEE